MFDHDQPGDPPPAPGATFTLQRCDALPGGVVRLHYGVFYPGPSA